MVDINNPSSKIQAPVVTLSGDLLTFSPDEATATSVTKTSSVVTIQGRKVTVDGNSVTKDGIYVFQGNVDVTITCDSRFTDINAINLPSGYFIGPNKNANSGRNQAETFYSVNGKPPKRTKNNLYYGSFTIRSNKSGGDNTFLKAVSYGNGEKSDITEVDFRISRTDSSIY